MSSKQAVQPALPLELLEPVPPAGAGKMVRALQPVTGGDADSHGGTAVVERFPQQLAFAMFSEMKSGGGQTLVEIDQAPKDVGYCKASVLIDTKGLSLVARRLSNAIYYIVSQSPGFRRYDISLQYLMWLSRYTSKNTSHVKKALDELQQTRIEATAWAQSGKCPDILSTQLIGEYRMRGGRIRVDIPEAINNVLTTPNLYSYLSLCVLARLTNNHAAALYERLNQIEAAGNVHWSGWVPVEDIREWFGKRGEPLKQDWKYLRRDVLEPAVEGVNQHTDLDVEYVARSEGRGRQITHVLFSVRRSTDPAKRLPAAMLEQDRALFELLMNEFGLPNKELMEIEENRERWDNEAIEAAIEFTRYRIRIAANDRPVRRPGGLLMKALREGLRVGRHELEAEQQARDRVARASAASAEVRQRRVAEDQQNAEAIEAAVCRFLALDEAAQDEWIAKFKRAPAFRAVRSQIEKAGGGRDLRMAIESTVVRGAIGGYLLAAGG